MYEIDFTTLSAILNSFFSIVGGVLRFDTAAIEAIFTQEGGNGIAIAILILGGISIGIGQSIVLFANQVSRRRFILSLLVSGIGFLLWVILWAASTWLLLVIFRGAVFSFMEILLGAAVSMAPLLFGFLVLLPYIGNLIFQFLRIWILLIYLVVINAAANINYLVALMFAGLGWLLIELVLRLPPLQFERLRNWGWQRVTGTPRRLDIDEVAQQFIDEVHSRFGDAENHHQGGAQ